MREITIGFSLLIAAFVALVFQEVTPVTILPAGARLQLVPLIFCFAAFYLSFPLMLVFALLSGLLFDLMQLQFVDGRPEIALGTTMFFFLLIGAVCQGLRPLFLQGHWWLLSIMAGISTSALPALQYLLISLRRLESSGLVWTEDAVWRILLPGLVAAALAPLAQMAVHLVSMGIGADEKQGIRT